MFKGTIIASQTRQFLWKNMLKNSQVATRYEDTLKHNRMLTVSQFEVQIQ